MEQRIEEVFRVVDRAKFMPEQVADMADIDHAMPIGFSQTISQPTTVKLMLGWLDPKPGERILDVGSGSGWTTALLSHLVGLDGRIYAVERVPELVEFGQKNAERFGVKNAGFYLAGNELGLPNEAPFDRILVSAAANELPRALLNQLKIGGKMVVPVQSDILEITLGSSKNPDVIKHPGFVFVPLL